MHEDIKRRWNERVTNADTVYLLGDILWKVNDETIALVSQLKGHKVLVKGNHCRVNDHRYSCLFDEICDYKEVSDNIRGINHQLVLSHFPILMWKNMQRGWIHLYGHVHTSQDWQMYKDALKLVEDCYAKRDKNHNPFLAFNVGCMCPYMNYAPRTLEEIIAGSNGE